MYQCIVLSFAETKIYSFLSPESYKPSLSYPMIVALLPSQEGRDVQASGGLSSTCLHMGHVGLLPAGSHAAV